VRERSWGQRTPDSSCGEPLPRLLATGSSLEGNIPRSVRKAERKEGSAACRLLRLYYAVMTTVSLPVADCIGLPFTVPVSVIFQTELPIGALLPIVNVHVNLSDLPGLMVIGLIPPHVPFPWLPSANVILKVQSVTMNALVPLFLLVDVAVPDEP
jgi:hypothetical protein